MGTHGFDATGIVVNKGGTLRMIECAFLGNDDADVHKSFSSHIISNIGGTLEMRRNCFVGNEVDFAPVVSHSVNQPVLLDNYGGEKAQDSECQFAAISSSVYEGGFECMEFDRSTCYIEYGFATPGNHLTAQQQPRASQSCRVTTSLSLLSFLLIWARFF